MMTGVASDFVMKDGRADTVFFKNCFEFYNFINILYFFVIS